MASSSLFPPPRFASRGTFIGRPLRNLWARFEAELLDGLLPTQPMVTPALNRVMALIDEDGTQTGELARRAGITKQSMAETVTQMVEHGLVERLPDPTDRRARLIALTPKGLEALLAGRVVAEGIHQRWTGVVGERDMARLQALLQRLDDGLGLEG